MTDLNELKTEFPKIFPENFHFECGDGWYNILKVLCFAIQACIDGNNERRALHLQINKAIDDSKPEDLPEWMRSDFERGMLLKREVPDAIPQVVVTQVKEKFGGLRFYYHGGNETIENYCTFAELLSTVTCEECGNPGKRGGKGWIKTMCEEHATERVV